MADAEKVVLELEARRAGFSASLKQGAAEVATFASAAEQSANKAEVAIVRTGNAVVKSQAQIAAGQRNLGRQFADFGQSLSGGSSFLTVLAQQLPQVTDALSDTGGKVGRVAEALSGPFGAAAIAVGSILATTLIPKLLEAGDATDALVDKMKEQGRQRELTARATDIYKHSEEGVTQAIRDATRARQEATEKDKSAARQAVDSANANLIEITSIRAKTKALLEQALAQAEIDRQRATAPGQRGELAALASEQSTNRVAALQSQLAENSKSLTAAQTELNAAVKDYAVELGKRVGDTTAQINHRYDEAVIAARKNATAQEALNGTLTRRIGLLGVARDAELKLVQAAESAANRKPDNNQIGRIVTVAEATAIINGIGGTVTNGYRSRATQERLYAEKLAGTHIGPVAKPGTSDHETGNAIDVAYGPGISVASIKEAFRKQGVAIKQLLDEPTQRIYHVAFGDGGAARKADSDARKAEVDRVRAIRDNEAYENDKQALNAQIVAAMRAQAVEAKDIAQFQRDEVEAATTRKVNAINADEAAGKYTHQQAQNLRNLALQGDALQKLAIGVELQRRQQDEANARIAANLRNQEDILSAQLAIADTNAKRKAIELQLLNLKYQELRQQQQAIVSDTTGRYSAEQRAEAQNRLGTLTDLQRAETVGVDQRYEGPLAAYRRSLNDPDTQVQQAVVDRLEQLNTDIADAAASVLGVKDPLLKSLLQIFLQQNVLKPLYDALSQSGGGGFFGAIASGIGAIFGGGGGDLNALLAQGNGAPPPVALTGLAGGGTIDVMGRGGIDRNLLSLNGQPIARVNRGEQIAVGANARATSPGSGVVITVQVAAGEYFDARVASVSGPIARDTSIQVVRAAAPEITKTALRQTPGYLAQSQQLGQPRTI